MQDLCFIQTIKKMKKARNVLMMLIALVFAACATPGERAPDEHKGVIIVANKSGDNVHFVDRRTGDVILELPTGLEPHEVVVSDDGALAVICNYGNRENPGNTLSVYDVAAGSLTRTIDLGEHTRPHGMQWMPGTTKILVTAEGSRNLLVVDVDAGQVVRSMYTGQDVSHMVAATPDMRRAFVPSIRTGNVTVFDLETGELLAQVFSGRGAEGIDVSPDGKEVWVTNRADNTIAIIDAESLEVLQVIECEDFPIRARFTPDGSLFLVSNARSGDVAVFDAKNRELIRAIKLTPPVPEGQDDERYFADFEGTSVPIGLVIPDNQKAYVANTRSDAISVIDLETFEITRHFIVGKEPDGIAFSPLFPDVD
jgi:YVTN family beta-propeller protein